MDEQWLKDAIRNFETKSVEEAEMWGVRQGNTEHGFAFLQWNKRRELIEIEHRRARDLAIAEQNALNAEVSAKAAQDAAAASIRAAKANEDSAEVGRKTLRVSLLALICSVAALAISAFPLVFK